MSGRAGPFWDGVEGRAPVPAAAATLGFEFIGADVERGTIEVAFSATEAFTNPAGNVLGAFLAAMLYDTVGPALLATLEPGQFQSTVQLNVSFHRHRAGDRAEPGPSRGLTPLVRLPPLSRTPARRTGTSRPKVAQDHQISLLGAYSPEAERSQSPTALARSSWPGTTRASMRIPTIKRSPGSPC